MSRKEEIAAASNRLVPGKDPYRHEAFKNGVEWADQNPMILAKEHINKANAKVKIAVEAIIQGHNLNYCSCPDGYNCVLAEALNKLKD